MLYAMIDLRKARTFAGLAVPATTHQRVDRERRIVRTAEHVALLYVLDDLFVCEAVIRLQGKGEDLPEANAKGPDIRLQ